MRETDDPNMPTSPVLDALRRPRRTQLHDPQVKALLAQWKRRGRGIEYLDLDEVAALIRVENPKASTRRPIVAAVKRPASRSTTWTAGAGRWQSEA